MSTPTKEKALYEAVTCVLSCCLQPDSSIQKMANERKKALEVVDEYPIILTEIISSNEEAAPERHIASVFLKNYLEEIYLQTRDNPSLFDKGLGKQLCLQLLELLNIKYFQIRLMVSYSLSYLCAMEFWDFLAPRLQEMLKSGNPDLIHNAVFLLKNIIDNKFFQTSDDFKVQSYWFDLLLDVFKMTHLKAETRANSIQPMYIMMKYIREYENFLPECLTKLAEEFEKALAEPYSPTSDFSLKCEILRCLYDSAEHFSDYSNIIIPPCLPAIGNLLTVCCEQYKKIVRNTDKAPKDASEEEEDEPKNFYELISWILDFIYSMVDLIYFDVLIDDLDNLLYCIFVFMSCHSDMEQNLFLEDHEKDHRWAIRVLGYQIIVYAIKKIESHRRNGRALFFKSMHQVFQKLNSDLEQSGSTTDNMYKVIYLTRITESMIFGLGIAAPYFTKTNLEFVFPLDYYIDNWTTLMQSQQSMMLNGRMLWLGGKYSEELQPNTLGVHLKAILQNFNSQEKFVLVPSAEALQNHLKTAKQLSAQSQYIISTFAKDIIVCLLAIAQKPCIPLSHSLNALGYFIKSHKEISSDNIDTIEDILITTMIAHFSNTLIMKEICFITAKLAQKQIFKPPLHDKYLTFLLNIVHHGVPKELKDDQDKALDLINTYCLYSTSMDDLFILQAFCGAAMLLTKNNDPELDFVDEAAGLLLTTLIVKVPNQLKYIRDTIKGNLILEDFPKLIEMLLQPDSKLPGHVAGKLVVASIFALPEVMERHFEAILRNVITSNCLHFQNVRSTWIIFLFICMIRPSSTISYLSILPGPNGGSALNYIMRMWMPGFNASLVKIERQIMSLSITQIIQNCLEKESDFKKMEDLCVPFDGPNEEQPTGEHFNGIEYFYYLLIEILFFEQKENKDKSANGDALIFENYGEDAYKKKYEDDEILFHNHPFNVNITNHIVSFLKSGNDPYFTVVKKFVAPNKYFRLRDLGCAVPELNLHEDME